MGAENWHINCIGKNDVQGEIARMKIPERYIKRGKFKLHSGGTSDILYDVNKMLVVRKYDLEVMNRMLSYKDVKVGVGIATGGALIACRHWDFWAMIKDGKLNGEVKKDYLLIDDVCTTESSIKEAIKIIGKKPKYIFVVVDRRKKKTLDIQSIFQV